jgi:hypothetical protein
VVDVELPGGSNGVIQLRPNTVSGYPSSIFPVAVHPSDPRWKPEPPDEAGGGKPGYWP